ncbi:hypothetical protein ACQEVF_56725 [Nonomuraea polychroma]|uniref:hypothetical protein n=1 Tax=Nonomuraea polychroma TaxID=46176 RepID=UPI003D8CE355
MRRRTLLTAAALAVPADLLDLLDDTLATMPASPYPPLAAQINARLAHATTLYDKGDLATLLSVLPPLLTAAHEAAERDATPDAYARATDCYVLATEALTKIGKHPTGRITADRATALARASGSPIAIALASRALSIVLRHEDRHTLADQITLDGLTQLEATGLTRQPEIAAYAQMLCTSAYTAAHAGDRDRALELIGNAEQVAARLDGPRPRRPRTITPPQVTLYKVGVHWSLGDAGTALHTGRALHDSQFPTPERRVRLHTDLARAWWQWNKPEQTLRELLTAHHHAPDEVRHRASIRTIATQLIEQHPRTPGTAELRAAVGYGKRSPSHA